MDLFRTIVEIPESPNKISYRSVIMLIGSCFSDYMGERLLYHKFNALLNPFGVLFNPASIARSINIIIERKLLMPQELIFHNGQWISLNHYTGFSHPNQQVCLNRINKGITETHQNLKNADFLFITFGTAWVYTYNESGDIVANCHKIPASSFTRRLLQPQEIIDFFSDLLKALKQFNNKLHIVFTLSPVRHWKDGAVSNQQSKAILHYAIQSIIERHPYSAYFPVYEIFMDELRDYRFYGTDMLHPAESGINYIWKRFVDTFIEKESLPLMNKLASLMKAYNHKPNNPDDPAFIEFLQSTLSGMEELSNSNPFIDFTTEKEILVKRLKALK
jgi:hypothetical protein